MHLQSVDVVSGIERAEFREKYFLPRVPLIIKNMSKEWPAYTKWNWEYFKSIVGEERVGIYNNVKSDAYTPINKADEYTTFGKYIDMISNGPAEWRIFAFNVFTHAPQLKEDFTWPTHLMGGFIKRFPFLFVGGQGSITHMHFDIDFSNIFHAQFLGKKRVLLFPYTEQHKLYRKPFEVLSLADFSNYYDKEKSKLNFSDFPAIKQAKGYEVILDHGDTLFMPGGYWHHMEYIESGFALTLRAVNNNPAKMMQGFWNLMGMRNIDNVMKKAAPHTWYEWKKTKIFEKADEVM
jgi:hypothetical protein